MFHLNYVLYDLELSLIPARQLRRNVFTQYEDFPFHPILTSLDSL